MRLIILAAGQSLSLDGVIKSLIINPVTGMSLIEHACRSFSFCDITVVVGYKAIEIMQRFPSLRYVYNHDWAVTNNAYSLGLALDDTPSYVISGDLLFSENLARRLELETPNMALTSTRENRILTAINCVITNDRITETYIGPLRSVSDPEAIGIFKISDQNLLRLWKQRCLKHGNLFVGQTLPIDDDYNPIYSVQFPIDEKLYEINTVLDYIRLIEFTNGDYNARA